MERKTKNLIQCKQQNLTMQRPFSGPRSSRSKKQMQDIRGISLQEQREQKKHK
jgi:hypothetical protein